MLRSLFSGISGMKINQVKLDVNANNITNSSTTAFKSSRVLFQDALGQSLSESLKPGLNQGGQNGKTVGLGATVASIGKTMTEGTPQPTESNYDCAISGGEGYFVVAKGPNNGTATVTHTGGDSDTASTAHTVTTNASFNLKFTRDGSFTHDEKGNLLTANGDRVLGYSIGESTPSIVRDETTGEVTANFVDANTSDLKANEGTLIPLAIPTEVKGEGEGEDHIAVTSFSIGADGLITGVLANGKTTAIGQIALASFKNPAALSEQGQNCFVSSANSGEAIIKSGIGSTENDNSKAYGSVRQYALEMSNVDLSQQFTDMIVASRAFQANGKTITNGDEILQDIINLKR